MELLSVNMYTKLDIFIHNYKWDLNECSQFEPIQINFNYYTQWESIYLTMFISFYKSHSNYIFICYIYTEGTKENCLPGSMLSLIHNCTGTHWRLFNSMSTRRMVLRRLINWIALCCPHIHYKLFGGSGNK